MAPRPLGVVLRHVRELTRAPAATLSDAQLLGRFIAHGDEAAFAALVQRHGRLVLSVCRRALGHEQDAEDAFQATFLLLARHAASVRQRDSLASWLHGIAYRTALNARRSAMRRQRYEQQAGQRLSDAPASAAALRELQALLDEEVQRLPAKYRAPFVLCCLEGKSRAEAARELGWKEGTVSGRLAEARQRLQQRLARRGVELSAVLTAAALAGGEATAALTTSAVRAAALIAAGQALTADGVSAEVSALVKAVSEGMMVAKMKLMAAFVAALGLLAAGAGLAAHQAISTRQEAKSASAPERPSKGGDEPKPGGGPPARRDLHDDPLPPHALARMGTMRWRHDAGQNSTTLPVFSPDGKTLATAASLTRRGLEVQTGLPTDDLARPGFEGTLRLWDPATGKLKASVKAADYFGGTIRFAPDGKAVAVSGDTGVDLFDAATGQKLRRLATHEQPRSGRQFTFARDGKLLVAVSHPGSVAVWDVASGKQVRKLPDQPDGVFGAAFTPDAKTLVCVGPGPRVSRWDVATGERQGDTKLDTEADGGALSPDGQTLALWTPKDRVLKLFDAVTGQEGVKLEGEPAKVRCLAFSIDGRTLVAGRSDDENRGPGSLTFWDVASGKQQRRFAVPAPLLDQAVFSPDGRAVLTGDGNRVFCLWDAATGKRLASPPCHDDWVTDLAFTPDGRTLISGAHDGSLHVWDAATGRHHHEPTAHRGGVVDLAVLPGARAVVSAGVEDGLRWHELATGKELRRLALWPEGKTGRPVFLQAVSSDPATDPCRLALVVGVRESQEKWESWAQFHDADTGKLLGRRESVGSWEEAFSPDGRLLARRRYNYPRPFLNAVADNDTVNKTQVVLEEAETGRELLVLSLPDYVNWFRPFTPDGRGLVTITSTSSTDSGKPQKGSTTVRLWELCSGKERLMFSYGPLGENIDPEEVACSPNGRVLAVANIDRVIRLWDLHTGSELGRRVGYASRVESLRFRPDGAALASGHADGTVLLWDLAGIVPPARPAALKAAEADALWADLAGADAAKAYRAVLALAAAPGRSVPLLRGRLRPAAAPPEGRVRQLVKDLDSDRFAVREAAAKELETLADRAEGELRALAKTELSPEQSRRLEDLLRPSLTARDPDLLRAFRAIEVLERIGTPEARQALEALARGAPEARLTREAKAALERLARRPAAP